MRRAAARAGRDELAAGPARAARASAAMSLFYVGGMSLNDYFDRAIDARERPQRPIPVGDISAVTVRVFGLGMLGLGVALLAAVDVGAALTGVFLALAIVLYDAFHKGN